MDTDRVLIDLVLIAAGLAIVTATVVLVGQAHPAKRMRLWPASDGLQLNAAQSVISGLGLFVAVIGGTQFERHVGYWAFVAVFVPLVLAQAVVAVVHNLAVQRHSETPRTDPDSTPTGGPADAVDRPREE